MAKVTLTGKRKPVCETQGACFSWSKSGNYEEIAVTFMTDDTASGKHRYLRATFPTNEAVSLACYIAQRFSRRLCDETPGLYARRTDAQALRELADVLDGTRDPDDREGPDREELIKPRPAPWNNR